jgi:ABC-type transporter Mla MlaB component
VAILTVYDDATEYRIEIAGNFVDSAVREADQNWRKALSENIQRKITVDISQLSNYDSAGCRLLRKMHQHGTVIAAATPRSLVFLQEITASPRRGPALIRQAASPKQREANRPPDTKTFAAGK